jgi:hypothetical protein
MLVGLVGAPGAEVPFQAGSQQALVAISDGQSYLVPHWSPRPAKEADFHDVQDVVVREVQEYL